MSTRQDEFVAHCLELLATIGGTRSRRMFGGYGLYVDDLFVALIASERLYLKVDAQTRERFESAGCTPFAYSAKDRAAVTMSYWSAPDSALDSPTLMQPWAQLALAAALRARAAKRVSVRTPAGGVARHRATSRNGAKAKR